MRGVLGLGEGGSLDKEEHMTTTTLCIILVSLAALLFVVTFVAFLIKQVPEEVGGWAFVVALVLVVLTAYVALNAYADHSKQPPATHRSE